LKTLALALLLSLPGFAAESSSFRPNVELKIKNQVVVRSKDVEKATPIHNGGNWGVLLKLNAAATKKFAQVTKANLGKKMDIVLDGMTISSPKISAAITSGTIVLSESFSEEEATGIVARFGYK
jgi:preprotein translocase subunit SecD